MSALPTSSTRAGLHYTLSKKLPSACESISRRDEIWLTERVRELLRRDWQVVPAIYQAWADLRALRGYA
jgi:hypothetical protein